MKQIFETNIVVLLQEAEKLMKAGWSVVEFHHMGLLEASFEKLDGTSPKLAFSDRTETKTIEGYATLDVLGQMKLLIDNGYTFTDTNFYWDSTGFKRINMVNEHVPEKLLYTLQELDNMDWESLRALGKFYGVFNRSRAVMVSGILRAQQEGESDEK